MLTRCSGAAEAKSESRGVPANLVCASLHLGRCKHLLGAALLYKPVNKVQYYVWGSRTTPLCLVRDSEAAVFTSQPVGQH